MTPVTLSHCLHEVTIRQNISSVSAHFSSPQFCLQFFSIVTQESQWHQILWEKSWSFCQTCFCFHKQKRYLNFEYLVARKDKGGCNLILLKIRLRACFEPRGVLVSRCQPGAWWHLMLKGVCSPGKIRPGLVSSQLLPFVICSTKKSPKARGRWI